MSDSHEEVYGSRFKWAWFKWEDKKVVRRLTQMYAHNPRPDLDVYQFGVYTGVGGQCICEKLTKAGVSWGRFVGFDSFTGLPNEADKIAPDLMEGEHWNEGAFSAADALQEYDTEQLLAKIKGTIGYTDVVLVPGMFEDVLDPKLGAAMRPAMFVDVDCDLYISARQCLEWMLRHELIIVGTVVRYDDWKGTPEWQGGESLAHLEVTEIYGLAWERVSFNVFVLTGRDTVS